MRSSWLTALGFALPSAVLLIGLYYYWFAIADRYTIFLYYHEMGPLVADTSPFSRVTASRYWMTGLVAAGLLMVLYVGANLALGRLKAIYRAPDWWRVWLLTAVPLAVGLILITTTQNQPSLTLNLALDTTAVALLGLALAYIPGRTAAEDPLELLLLTVDGMGLMFLMLTLISAGRIRGWLERGSTLFVIMFLLALAISLIILALNTVIRVWRRRPGRWQSVFIAGLCVSYLLMPLIHYLGFTDGYFYITDTDNFFARNLLLQTAAWLAALLLAYGSTRLRLFLLREYTVPLPL